MKRMFRSRLGCTAVCLSLSLALGCSCALMPPASTPTSDQPASSTAASIPTDAAGKPLYDPTLLEDGRLRILYSEGSSGSTVLCGSTVLYRGRSSETISLLQDDATGETNYWFRSWSDNSVADRRRSALYDKTGAEVMTFDEDYMANLTDGFLVLSHSTFYEEPQDVGSCRVIELSTGRELTVPENAYTCTVCGGYFFYRCYQRPADLAEDAWDDETSLHTTTVIQDKDGNTVRTIPSCTTSAVASYDSALTGWIALDVYSEETSQPTSFLYNPATGEELSGFVNVCGNGTVCFSTEDDRYDLRDMTAEGYPVLGTFDEQPSIYFPGSVVVWNTRRDYRYELHDLVSGDSTLLYSAESNNNTVALYAETGSLRVYDQATGELLTDVTVEPVENQQSVMMDNEGNGYVWLELRDNDNYETTATRVYGPAGLVSDLTPLQSTYNYLGYLTTTTDGQPLYYGTYNAPGSSYGILRDVLDQNGNVVIRGLATCYGYYSNSLNGLPDGLFVARRGFYSGWMDPDGNWIFCQSVFGSLDGDDDTSYYF